MNRLTILGLLYLLSTLSLCQIPSVLYPYKIDSLYSRLKMAEGTAKVDILNGLALYLAPRYFDSSMHCAGKALHLAKKFNYKKGIGIAAFNAGNSYYFKADIKNALTNYLSALRLLELYEPSKEIGNLLLQLGAINQYVRNTEKSTVYYKRAIQNYAAIGDSVAAIKAYWNLGDSYYYKYQTLGGLDVLSSENATRMLDSSKKFIGIVSEYYARHPDATLIPGLYNDLGVKCQETKDPHALDYFFLALDACDKIPDTNKRKNKRGMVLMDIGFYYYFFKGDLDRGYAYSLQAKDNINSFDFYDDLGAALSTLGEIDIDRGNYRSAATNLYQSISVLDKFIVNIGQTKVEDPVYRIWGVTQARAWRLTGLFDLVKLHELRGDYKQALKFQKMLEKEKRLQNMDELNREIIGLQANYEDDIKRQEITTLKRDNELRRLKLNRTRILFAGFGCLLLITLLIILLLIQRKQFRSDRKALVLEQKLLRAQMNPHFIFNSLYSIQNFIVTEKPDKASIYLSKFARLVRNILDNSTVEYVTLEKEIGTIENYLELQQVRYAGKFDYSIYLADEIDAEIMMIPPMLAQPFIENAIEHGIKHRETPGHIDIRFNLDYHTLLFEVEDNGIGRLKARELSKMQEPGHRSMATSLTHERLVNLNRKQSKKIVLDILDLKDSEGEAAGTRVTFGIPISR